MSSATSVAAIACDDAQHRGGAQLLPGRGSAARGDGATGTILILADALSQEARRVVDHLRARSADVVWFDPSAFPASADVALRYTATGSASFRLRTTDRTLDLDQVASAWHWHHQAPVAPGGLVDPLARRVAEDAGKALVESTWQALTCSWLPARPSAIRGAKRKAAQLRVAGEVGLELPPTLITNDPEEFVAFYREHDGAIISKLVDGFGWDSADGDSFLFRYAEPVLTRDVGYAAALRQCPVIFQAAVPKRVEVRAYVVDDQVLAAEIHSQETNRTRFDWRKYDRFHTRYTVHQLPDLVERRCRLLARRLGLRYGGIDLILTPDGRYVFLEINTHGHFEWIEVAAGLPVSAAIADALLADAAQPVQVEVGR